VLREIKAGCAKRIYEGGRIEGDKFLAARWDLAQADRHICGRMFNGANHWDATGIKAYDI
jgi:hypothetical protein